MPSKNNPHRSEYFHVNFIPSLIAVLITQNVYREYLSVNDTQSGTILTISIQVLCHVVDLKHGFVTNWKNVLFTLENIGMCVKITWNYFPCLVLHKVSFHRLCARFFAVIIEIWEKDLLSG